MVERKSQFTQEMVLDWLLQNKNSIAALETICSRISFSNLPHGEAQRLKKKGEDTTLIFCCLPTLRSCLRHYQEFGLEERGLFDEGFFALQEAVSQWDPDKRLKSGRPYYLTMFVSGNIHLRLQSHITEAYGLGGYDFPLVCLFWQCWRGLVEDNDRSPTLDKIVSEVLAENISRLPPVEPDIKTLVEKTASMYDFRLAKDQISLDEAGREVVDKPPEKLLENDFLREELEKALKTLPSNQAQIIRQRFGLDGQRKTYEEIAKELGVTKERIRQIEKKALGKLRHPYRSRRFRDFLASS